MVQKNITIKKKIKELSTLRAELKITQLNLLNTYMILMVQNNHLIHFYNVA